jgi:transcriptional regulator with XRE-family HTH domain
MEELTRLRVEQGWTQQRLADESNVNKATINQIEKGRRSPNIETLEKLANALGVGVADFFPKAQAPLWSDESPAKRRPSILPEATISTVEKWISIASDPDTNEWKSFGIADAASALGESIEDIIERADGVSWESLPIREQHEIMQVMEKVTEVLQSATQRVKDEPLEEEFRQRREKIREWTRRLSA